MAPWLPGCRCLLLLWAARPPRQPVRFPPVPAHRRVLVWGCMSSEASPEPTSPGHGRHPRPRLTPHTPGSSRCGQRRALVRRLTVSTGLLPPLFSKILHWASPLGVAKYSCVYLYKCMAKERPHLFSLADGFLKAVFCRPSFSPAIGDFIRRAACCERCRLMDALGLRLSRGVSSRHKRVFVLGCA